MKNDLKHRTKQFAIDIFRFVDELPENSKGWTVKNQILRSSSSEAANYRAVCRAKSDKDFISKMGTVLEESDETQFWLELIMETNLVDASKNEELKRLQKETDELTSIFASSLITIKKRVNKNSKFKNS